MSETLTTKAEQTFAEHFEAAKPKLPGDAWVQKLRGEAWETYASSGLPHRRVEEWKYTDLRALLKEAYPPALPARRELTDETVDAALGELAAIDSHRVVIVDGALDRGLSAMNAPGRHGEVLALEDALSDPPEWLGSVLGQVNPPEKADSVVALNAAFMSSGAVIRIGRDARLDKPLHIVHLITSEDAASVATRNVVVVEDGAQVTLIESYVSGSAAPAQRNAVTELMAGDGARVEHVKYQNESIESAHLTTWMVRLGAETRYRAFQFSLGAGVARNQIFLAFAGEGASSHINGAVLGLGKQHNDTTMVVDHAVPGCESREFNKFVLDDEARGVVQCKVNVHRDAQKSDGHQMAHGLLLSERAEFDSKPELEIFADDVVCGHGSTSGHIDEDLLFYLRSRGIPEPRARALLILAFVGEALDEMENETVRDALSRTAMGWLNVELE